MKKQQQMVLEFHRTFDLNIGPYPEFPDDKECALRAKLIQEEFYELMVALADSTLSDVAKEAADLIYVVLAMAVSFGFDMESVFNEVHRSNMTKIGGKIVDGKLIKPSTYQKADIKSVLKPW